MVKLGQGFAENLVTGTDRLTECAKIVKITHFCEGEIGFEIFVNFCILRLWNKEKLYSVEILKYSVCNQYRSQHSGNNFLSKQYEISFQVFRQNGF